MPRHDDGQDDLSALVFFDTHKSRSDDDRSAERQALAFSTAGKDSAPEASGDALRAQTSDQPQDTTTDRDAILSASNTATDDAQNDEWSEYLVKVTNPPGTVSVTAILDGTIQQIDLSAKVTSMTESALADEILVIADLAAQKGLATQQALIADTVREMKLDDGGAARDLIEESVDLPTLQQAVEAQAKLFASRYTAGTD